jgi:hypothetical protein
MQVAFTKLSAQQHRFALIRADGSREAVVLESRSYLVHDWVHFAVEAELPIVDGFYGQLASGMPLGRLNDRSRPMLEAHGGLALAEALVGPMQSLHRGRLTREAYLALARPKLPGRVSAAFVERAQERLRRLTGFWRATPYGRDMVLGWPAPPLVEHTPG